MAVRYFHPTDSRACVAYRVNDDGSVSKASTFRPEWRDSDWEDLYDLLGPDLDDLTNGSMTEVAEYQVVMWLTRFN